jgi:repressor LexA
VGNPGKLSSRQNRMLEMIREFVGEFGYPPSIRQIGEAVNISSTSVVSYNLDVLQRKGYLARDPEVSRGLRLVEDDDDALGYAEQEAFQARGVRPQFLVPVLGVIAAGEPIPFPDSDFAPTDYEQIALPPDLLRDAEDVYALRVRGTSMIDALINDGDIVIMRHQQSGENGEMVAAWLKDEKATTLKRIYWEQDHKMVRLQPANPLMEPIYVHPSNLEIQGRVIGVLRLLD